jgi:hypothetical protein
MPTRFHPPHDSTGLPFPSLPVINPDPPRRSERERFGALLYLGVAGLALVVALVGWFGWEVWSLRSVWSNVYVLHNARRGEPERVQAAYALSRDRRVNQRQLWDIALRKPLPPLARYVVAEALTAEAASADPGGYGASVARSEGWPAWLRLLLTRPLAYAAALGRPVPSEPLAELARHPDPAVALWARFALAAAPGGPAPEAAAALRAAARSDAPEPERDLARLLVEALDAPRLLGRLRALDEATVWLRRHHPDAAALWEGWEIQGNRLVRRPAPELH